MSDDESDYESDDETDSHEIRERLDRIAAAIRSNTTSRTEILWIILIALFAWPACSAILSDIWHSDTRYVIQYGVNYDQVARNKKPHDCDFLHSPIGEKECHYDVEVDTVQVRPNQWGGQSISYDEGQTWIQTTSPSTDGTVIESDDNGRTWSTPYTPLHVEPHVQISWKKVDEDAN
jgi:hypothetical protein